MTTAKKRTVKTLDQGRKGKIRIPTKSKKCGKKSGGDLLSIGVPRFNLRETPMFDTYINRAITVE